MKEEDKMFIHDYYMLKFKDNVKKIEEDFYNNIEAFFEENKAKLEAKKRKNKKGGGKKKKG
jgi:hypothetical protein